MIRYVTVASILAVVAAIGAAPVAALAKSDKAAASEKAVSDKAAKTAKAADKKPKEDKAGGKLLETFGDWTASVAQGKTKTCYALARPKARSPEGKRDQAYVFIADRPTEKVHSEVSVIMGFPIKEGSAAKAKIGKTSFDLVAVANAFFMKEPADDSHFVDAMKRGGALIVKAIPAKGEPVTDTYALMGFKPALDRAQKECR